MAKNGHVHEGGKVGRNDATPTKFISVDSNNLKSMSFKFGNDIFITYEMPGVAYSRPVDKIHISLQFHPSVIRGPCFSIHSKIGWFFHKFSRNPVCHNKTRHLNLLTKDFI